MKRSPEPRRQSPTDSRYPAWLDALLEGDAPPSPDVPRAVVSAALGLLNAGHSPQEARAVLWASSGVGEKVRTPKFGPGWLDRRVQLAHARWQSSPANGADGQVRTFGVVTELRGLVGTLRLSARGVSTGAVQEVLDAFLQVAEDAGRTHSVGVSVAELARRTALGDRTVARALKVLRDSHVLVRETDAVLAGDEPRAATYRLDVQRLRVLTRPDWVQHATTEVEARAARLQSHDAWVRGGLGVAGRRVWQLLDTGTAQSATELARRTTWTRQHVSARLEALATYGLARRAGTGWVRCSTERAQQLLDDAARDRGTAGTGAARQSKRQERRAQWLKERRKYAARLRAERAERAVVVDPATGEQWVLDADTGELVRPEQHSNGPVSWWTDWPDGRRVRVTLTVRGGRVTVPDDAGREDGRDRADDAAPRGSTATADAAGLAT